MKESVKNILLQVGAILWGISPIILLFLLLMKCTESGGFRQPKAFAPPKIIYVDKIKLVEVLVPVEPSKIAVQKGVDSLYRKQKERETIVIGQSMTRQKNSKDSRYLHIQTIDSIGQIRQMEYELMEGDLYKMDSKGNLEIDEKNRKKLLKKAKRGKFFRSLKTVAVFAGGLVIGVILTK